MLKCSCLISPLTIWCQEAIWTFYWSSHRGRNVADIVPPSMFISETVKKRWGEPTGKRYSLTWMMVCVCARMYVCVTCMIHALTVCAKWEENPSIWLPFLDDFCYLSAAAPSRQYSTGGVGRRCAWEHLPSAVYVNINIWWRAWQWW